MLRFKYVIETANVDDLCASVIPELATAPIARSDTSVRVHKKENKIIISIEASSIASCRAATNSWLRLAMIAAEIGAIVAEPPESKLREKD